MHLLRVVNKIIIRLLGIVVHQWLLRHCKIPLKFSFCSYQEKNAHFIKQTIDRGMKKICYFCLFIFEVWNKVWAEVSLASFLRLEKASFVVASLTVSLNIMTSKNVVIAWMIKKHLISSYANPFLILLYRFNQIRS